MYFSVKVPMRIGGKKFRTCVCYALTDTLKSTVEKLSEKGNAEIYEQPVFFCNGKLVAKKEAVAEEKSVKVKKSKAKAVETAEAVEAEETELTEEEPSEEEPSEEDF